MLNNKKNLALKNKYKNALFKFFSLPSLIITRNDAYLYLFCKVYWRMDPRPQYTYDVDNKLAAQQLKLQKKFNIKLVFNYI